MVDNGTHSEKMIEHYKLIKPLGDGNFGVGWLAEDINTKAKVCVKLFKTMDEDTEGTFRAEVSAGQQGLHHPNVLRLMGAGKSQILKNGASEGQEVFYIVSELAENGESFDYVQMAGGLEAPYARALFKQIVDAVGFVHSKGVAHRDLKLENLFLAKDCIIKLADFGLMKAFAGPMGETLMTKCGTDNYMAPELRGENKPYAGPPVDIFAMGQMLFLMVYAKFAFSESTDIHYRRLIKNAPAAMKQKGLAFDKDFLDLLVGMLQPDASKRITMEEIKAHPWLAASAVSQEEVNVNFLTLKTQCKMDENEKEQELSKYMEEGVTSRGHGSAESLDEDQITELNEKVAMLEEGKNTHKDFEGECAGGFYTQQEPLMLLRFLWEFTTLKFKQVPEVSNNSWKLKVTLDQKEETVKYEADGDFSEGEEVIPAQAIKVDINIRMVEEAEEECDSDKFYVEFLRKPINKEEDADNLGSDALYNQFVRDVTKGCRMFGQKEDQE